jgi:hypothetical protein
VNTGSGSNTGVSFFPETGVGLSFLEKVATTMGTIRDDGKKNEYVPLPQEEGISGKNPKQTRKAAWGDKKVV